MKYLGIFLTFWVVSDDVLYYLVKESDSFPGNQPQTKWQISMPLTSELMLTSGEVQMLSLGCTVHMFLVSASLEQCGLA